MTATEPDCSERILVLTPTGRDTSLTCTLLKRAGLQAESCLQIEELCQKVEVAAGAAVLATEALGPPSLRLLTETLGRQPPWSHLPIVVFLGDSQIPQAGRQMLQVLESLPSVTLLERPVRTLTLVSAIRAALETRRRQYQVRNLLLQLEKGVQQRDEFLAILGHELRNPLGAVANAIEILDRISSREERAVHQREIIRRQTHHLVRLVDDLLDVSRITSGKIVLQRQSVELGEVARRTLQTLEGALQAQRHHLSFSSGTEPVLVEGDPVRLEQVVTNLVVNAIKYTPPEGRIDILVGDEGDDGFVRVEDNGVGIAEEMVPQVFELFTQVRGSLDRSQGGLGIGLTLVRSLVELHGGRVQAFSAGLGQGSTFMVWLPLFKRRMPSSEKMAPKVGTDHSGTASHHILIVEDDPYNRETLRLLLELDGHHVAVAGDGPTGVKKVLALRPELALVDLGLPGLTGYEVAERVRASPGGRDICLVALTGYSQPDDRKHALEAGFDHHLVKPVDLEELTKLVSSLGK